MTRLFCVGGGYALEIGCRVATGVLLRVSRPLVYVDIAQTQSPGCSAHRLAVHTAGRACHERGGDKPSNAHIRGCHQQQERPKLLATLSTAASIPLLHGRAWHIAIRAEDAAISIFRLRHHAALLASVEVLARVLGHDLALAMPARQTGDRRPRLHPIPPNVVMSRERRACKDSAAKARRARLCPS